MPSTRATRQQFARVERLGDVVVGAEVQAGHAIGSVALGGDHQDWHLAVVGVRTNLPAHFQSTCIEAVRSVTPERPQGVVGVEVQ
jgi:hypothetical protein